MTKLTIKNMVCRHCMATVSHLLTSHLGLPVKSVELGYATVGRDLTADELRRVAEALREEGFELIQSREAQVVEDIKHLLIEESRRDASGSRQPIADMLADRLAMSYSSLSRIFSEVEGRSIENYFINLRVERVKELIKYGRESLSEIAYLTGYSSPAHLSRQFKQITGLTPSQFRDLGSRTPLPEL